MKKTNQGGQMFKSDFTATWIKNRPAFFVAGRRVSRWHGYQYAVKNNIELPQKFNEWKWEQPGYQEGCVSCGETGRDHGDKCIYCKGAGFVTYNAPPIGPDYGCEHDRIDENDGKPFCENCGMPM